MSDRNDRLEEFWECSIGRYIHGVDLVLVGLIVGMAWIFWRVAG